MPRGRPKTRGYEGEPIIDDPAIQAALISGYAKGVGKWRLCNSLGVPETQLERKLADDFDFRKRWYAANVEYELSLITLQRGHAENNHKACEFLLERRFPDTWARKQPGVLTPEQVTAVVRRVASLAVEFVPADKQEHFVLAVGRIMHEAVAMAKQQVELGAGAEA